LQSHGGFRQRALPHSFQSPIRRGSRCNNCKCWIEEVAEVSVPYSSGQSLQCKLAELLVKVVQVSVPYLSGQALQSNCRAGWSCTGGFQSPICRGRRCNSAGA